MKITKACLNKLLSDVAFYKYVAVGNLRIYIEYDRDLLEIWDPDTNHTIADTERIHFYTANSPQACLSCILLEELITSHTLITNGI